MRMVQVHISTKLRNFRKLIPIAIAFAIASTFHQSIKAHFQHPFSDTVDLRIALALARSTLFPPTMNHEEKMQLKRVDYQRKLMAKTVRGVAGCGVSSGARWGFQGCRTPPPTLFHRAPVQPPATLVLAGTHFRSPQRVWPGRQPQEGMRCLLVCEGGLVMETSRPTTLSPASPQPQGGRGGKFTWGDVTDDINQALK